MAANQNNSSANKGQLSWKTTLLISFVVLFIGSVVTVIIFLTEPAAMRAGATKKTAMLVDVIRVKRGDFQPTIIATGTVEPAQDIILSPRISGEVIDRSPRFTPGGFVMKGETLLQIDPADYENALKLSKSDLQQAIADLKLEEGRQNVARQDYKLVDEELTEENKALVLRKPQLSAAHSRVEAAKASLEQAKLELQRTTIKAPFNAHILSRNVNIGSQVAPGNSLGRLVGMDNYWVAATVPVSHLRWLSFPDEEQEKGSKVKIKNRTAWSEGEYRTGYLYKLVGTLEDRTRLARVLVTVPDPLVRKPQLEGKPKMMLGSFVETSIQAEELKDVIRIDRDYIRKDETVWVMKDKKLRINDINVIFRDRKYAYLTSGLTENDSVVTTNLSTVVDGAPLRLESDTTKANQGGTKSSGGAL